MKKLTKNIFVALSALMLLMVAPSISNYALAQEAQDSAAVSEETSAMQDSTERSDDNSTFQDSVKQDDMTPIFYEAADDEVSEDGGSNLTLYGIIAAVVLIIILALVFRKKK